VIRVKSIVAEKVADIQKIVNGKINFPVNEMASIFFESFVFVFFICSGWHFPSVFFHWMLEREKKTRFFTGAGLYQCYPSELLFCC
jgi:hypothetical protein